MSVGVYLESDIVSCIIVTRGIPRNFLTSEFGIGMIMLDQK